MVTPDKGKVRVFCHTKGKVTKTWGSELFPSGLKRTVLLVSYFSSTKELGLAESTWNLSTWETETER